MISIDNNNVNYDDMNKNNINDNININDNDNDKNSISLTSNKYCFCCDTDEDNDDINQLNHMKLRCQCTIHSRCLVKYVKYQIGNKIILIILFKNILLIS